MTSNAEKLFFAYVSETGKWMGCPPARAGHDADHAELIAAGLIEISSASYPAGEPERDWITFTLAGEAFAAARGIQVH